MEIGIIIVAGGSGKRMGTQIPKQFLELNGQSILELNIQNIQTAIPNIHIVVVLPFNALTFWEENLASKFPEVKVVVGGAERFHSVKNGLEAMREVDLVMVHDGVRPFVSKQLLNDLITASESGEAIVPVLPVSDSLRKLVGGNQSTVVNRNDYMRVQTPQIFQYDVLKQAYEQTYQDSFTDDASVVEHYGISIKTVKGDDYNIKITTPFDLLLAEIIQHQFSN